MLDDDTRESPQHNLDTTQDVDAAARAVHVTHANRDALHRLRVSGEQFSEPSPDVGAIVVVQSDTVNPDVRGRLRRRFAIDCSRFGRRHLVSVLRIRTAHAGGAKSYIPSAGSGSAGRAVHSVHAALEGDSAGSACPFSGDREHYRNNGDDDHQNIEAQRHARREPDGDVVRPSERDRRHRCDAFDPAHTGEDRG